MSRVMMKIRMGFPAVGVSTGTLSLARAAFVERRRAMFWFALVGVAYGLYAGWAFHLVDKNSQQFEDLLQSFGEDMLSVLGVGELSLSTFEGYLALEFFPWYMLAVVIYATVAGAGQIANEAEDHTLDMVLALPIARSSLIMSRFLSIASVLTLISLSGFVGLVFGASLNATKFEVGTLLFASLQMIPISLAWSMLAMGVSIVTLSSRVSQMSMIGLLVAQLIIDRVAKVSESWEITGNFSLFHYYNVQYLSTGELPWSDVTVLFCVAVIGLVFSILAFNRRDIVT